MPLTAIFRANLGFSEIDETKYTTFSWEGPTVKYPAEANMQR